jgi:S-DNA-T family DNA segregation ATPase FtsK/SpoIIIE
LIYFGVSTILQDATVIGKIGALIGGFNKSYFGYLSYIYPFLLIYVAYLIKSHDKLDMRSLEVGFATILIFFALLIMQFVVFDSGFIGRSIAEFLSSFIGILGIWVFVVMLLALSAVSLADDFSSFMERRAEKREKPIHKEAEKIKKEPSKKPKAVKAVIKLEKIPSDTQEVVSSAQQQTKIDEYLAQKDEELLDSMVIQEERKTTIAPQEREIPEEARLEESPVDEEVFEEIADKEPHTTIVSELEENKRYLEGIEMGDVEKPDDFTLPSLDFLNDPKEVDNEINESDIDQKVQDLLEKLARFKIEGDVIRTYSGPVVTTFEFKPAPHIKVSKILNLQDDLAMALKAQTIRIQAPIPGKDVVGIEIPNKVIHTIYLKEILESEIFEKSSSPLTIALGKDIVGNPFITDLKKLPHLLIAGTTGSGKSVGINAMILSLLYKNSPETLRLVMIDPKMLEFSIYNDIPHLLTPVITQPKKAILALSNMVAEMERRYKLMSANKTKNIENYNDKVKVKGGEMLPYIVVIIDELADLMMTSGKDVEHSIARLAQMARASGIHLVVATQRPSVDVVTGLIKANLPSRISYKVGQRIDSKVILDQQGAESLLGRGDMLFTPPGSSTLVRLHAPFAGEDEIDEIAEFLREQQVVEYNESFIQESLGEGGSSYDDMGELDELIDEAKEVVINEQKTSISHIQRRLKIGYNRAASIVEQLEALGVVSEPNSKGIREIL